MNILQYTFSECPLGRLPYKHPVWNHRHLYRNPPIGIYQRGYYPRIIWRNRNWRIHWYQSDSGSHDLCHTERIWRSMDVIQKRCQERFCHRHVLDLGNERRNYLLLSHARLHARPTFVSLWQHPDDRRFWLMAIGHPDMYHHRRIHLFLRPIQSVAFDSTFARSQHLPVAAIEYLMMTLIAMTIVASLKWWASYWLSVCWQFRRWQPTCSPIIISRWFCQHHPGMDRLYHRTLCQLCAECSIRSHDYFVSIMVLCSVRQ